MSDKTRAAIAKREKRSQQTKSGKVALPKVTKKEATK